MSTRSGLLAGLLAIAVVGLLIGGCRGSSPDGTAENSPADPSAPPTATTDSVDADTGSTPPPSASNPAPGTARVRATIATCDTTGPSVRCQIDISKVLAYGSATPPLSPGDRTVHLAPSLLNDQSRRPLLETPHTLVLRHAGERPVLGDPAPERDQLEWTIQSVNAP